MNETAIRYKGYEIRPAPCQLQDTEKWTTNLFIAIEKGNERVERNFHPSNTCETKHEAIQFCIDLGKRIIDGQVKNCTVVDL